MQKVRFYYREIGNTPDAVNLDELYENLEYQYLSQGYKVFKQEALPIILPSATGGQDFAGWRILLTLVKDEVASGQSAKAKDK